MSCLLNLQRLALLTRSTARTFTSTTKSRKQFLLLAYDYTDPEALSRRLAVREAHMALAQQHSKSGFMILGGAILSESGEMIGSSIVLEASDETTAREKLDKDPYVVGKVWEKYELLPFRVAVK